MPELPEVETIVRVFRPRLVGRTVRAFRSFWPKNVSPSAAAVRRAIVGGRITGLRRRAKYIVFDFDRPGHLLVHLRMSGRFEWAADFARRGPHVRAIIAFDDRDALWFTDARKFGRILYTDDLATATAHLGFEPLERSFTARKLSRLLSKRSRRIKPLLLDQSLVVGLGNIYTDEALFRAGIHPLERCDRIDRDRVGALHKAVKRVLRNGIRRNGTSIDWIYPGGTMQDHLYVYGRAGEPCRRCGTAIEAIRVAQRGTHVCPCCQSRSGMDGSKQLTRLQDG